MKSSPVRVQDPALLGDQLFDGFQGRAVISRLRLLMQSLERRKPLQADQTLLAEVRSAVHE